MWCPCLPGAPSTPGGGYTKAVEADFVNLISYRVTATELVLEFGNFFPGQEGRAEADDDDMYIRVVMNADMLENLLHGLEEAKRARDKRRGVVPEQHVEK
jgi:hypothetical protein